MHKSLVLLALASLCACQTVVSTLPSLAVPPIVSPGPLVESTATIEPTTTPSPVATTPLPEATEEQAWLSSPHGLIASAAAAVPCRDCHKEDAGAIIGSQIAWWDAAAQAYQSVSDVNSLCQKCHDQPKPATQPAAAQSTIHKGLKCTACHDPHTTTASCTSSSCHPNVVQTNDLPPSTPVGGHPQFGNPFCGGRNCHPAATAAASQPRSVHGAAHVNVSCQACHAAGDLTAAPGVAGGPWVIWQEPVGTPSATAESYFPHVTQLEVDCQRCHFSNNPWGLPPVTGNEFQR